MFPDEFAAKYGAPHPSIRYSEEESDGDQWQEPSTTAAEADDGTKTPEQSPEKASMGVSTQARAGIFFFFFLQRTVTNECFENKIDEFKFSTKKKRKNESVKLLDLGEFETRRGEEPRG